MPFAYYRRLTPAEQRVYRRSDAVTAVPLPHSHGVWPRVGELAEALRSGDRLRTEAAADRLLRGLCAALEVSPVRAEVLAARPARHWGELHGLYTPAERGRPARVTLWMRTVGATPCDARRRGAGRPDWGERGRRHGPLESRRRRWLR